jgi:2-keto-3-deoxy-L-fuconate dehydrogenase
MQRLTGKTVLATASAQGIGKATALRMGQEGARVIATDVNETALAALQGEPGIETRKLDVTDKAAIAALVADIGQIDVLFNCAGFVHAGSILDATEEEWDFAFNLNVKSMFHMIRAVLPGMLAAGGGSIVNIASVAAHRGGGVNVAYSAAKGGLLALTRQLADDLAPYRVRVNSVSPGFTATPANAELRQQGAVARWQGRIPWGRYGEPGEVAAACLFLASADADYITGTDLIVDGGMSAVIRPETAAGV